MEKTIRDGKVAVLVSYGYGAGWYSWNTEYPEILFHPKLVKMVEDGDRLLITNELVEGLVSLKEGYSIFTGGAEQLFIEWIDEGTDFMITEYEGAEELEIIGDLDYLTA